MITKRKNNIVPVSKASVGGGVEVLDNSEFNKTPLLIWDYKEGIKVPGKQSFIAPKSGVFIQAFDDGETSDNWTITHQDTVVSCPAYGTYTADGNQLTLFLSKGDIFYRDTASEGYFYPFVKE